MKKRPRLTARRKLAPEDMPPRKAPGYLYPGDLINILSEEFLHITLPTLHKAVYVIIEAILQRIEAEGGAAIPHIGVVWFRRTPEQRLEKPHLLGRDVIPEGVWFTVKSCMVLHERLNTNHPVPWDRKPFKITQWREWGFKTESPATIMNRKAAAVRPARR